MQDRQKNYKNLSHKNSNSYEIFRYAPEEYQHSINLDKNYFILSRMFSNPDFALKMKRLISRDELSLESIEHTLFWLTKLFDVKWQQLNNDLDYISRWKINLQKQAEFILDNLVEDNQRQYKKSKDKKYISEERSDIISNTERTKIETTTEQNKGNLSETNTTEISEEKFWKSTSNDYITSTEETQIANHSELLKHDKDKDKSPDINTISIHQKFNVSTGDNSITNSTHFSKAKRHKRRHKNRNKHWKSKTSKLKKSRSTLHKKHVKDHEKLWGQLENINTSISPTENIISILEEIDQPNRMRTDTAHESLKNETDILRTRRRLDILVPWKIENKKNIHVPTKKIINEHNYFNKRMEMISDNAMDDILKAVAGVLPTNKSVETSRKRSERISNTL